MAGFLFFLPLQIGADDTIDGVVVFNIDGDDDDKVNNMFIY